MVSGRSQGRRSPDLLRVVLPGVSRSFALSLRLLPGSLRCPLGVTYLVARAADTLADTRLVPPAERRDHLAALRSALSDDAGPARLPIAAGVAADHPAAERNLLSRLPEVLAAYRALAPADRARAREVLVVLTGAMLDALTRFPAESEGRLGALETRAMLDEYTYGNAGCVGAFWTDMVVAHRPRCAAARMDRQRARGVRFGQGLQLVNVLRDLPRDLRLGRCYLPRNDLARLGLVPEDLLRPATASRLRPLFDELVHDAREGLEAGLEYTLAIPRREGRLRLACALPLWIGLGTLACLRRADNALDPGVIVKIPRAEVRRHLALAPVLAISNAALASHTRRLAAAI